MDLEEVCHNFDHFVNSLSSNISFTFVVITHFVFILDSASDIDAFISILHSNSIDSSYHLNHSADLTDFVDLSVRFPINKITHSMRTGVVRTEDLLLITEVHTEGIHMGQDVIGLEVRVQVGEVL